MKRAMVLALVAIGAIAVTATPASAHTKSFSSEVTISADFGPEGDAFKGKATSAKEFCVRNREVVLFRQNGTTKTRLGSDRTDSNGRWRVELSNPQFASPGDYYAQATRKVVTRPGHKHTCKPARSPVYEHNPPGP